MRHVLMIGLAILTSFHLVACGSGKAPNPTTGRPPQSCLIVASSSEGLADGSARPPRSRCFRECHGAHGRRGLGYCEECIRATPYPERPRPGILGLHST